MSLEPEILNYIHHHRLTRDEEWTLELASELINQVFSTSISILPITEKDIKLDLEKLFNSFNSDTSLNDIVGDNWTISALQVNDIKECLKELKKPLIYEEIRLFDDDLFYQKFPYLEDDFLLTSSSIRTQRIKSKALSDNLGLKRILDFKGKGRIKMSTEEDFMVGISTAEELVDIGPIYELEQVIGEKETMAGVSEPWLGSEDLRIEFRNLLLEENSFIETHIPTCLSPPMMPREYENKGVNLINQPTEMARLVIESMEEMAMTDSQPELSNDTWDELDPFPCFSVTPPSSPPAHNKETPTKISNECLIPKENEGIHNSLRSENPILETVLFPRKHHNSDHRSNSFDPSSYLILRPFRPLPSKHRKQGTSTANLEYIEVEDLNGHEVIKELESLLAKADHEGDYENERFEIPDNSTGSPPKRIKINPPVPASPPMRHRGVPDIYRPNFQDFGLSEGVLQEEGRNQWLLSREVNKVEGLKSLNIDLSWTPYTLPGPLNVERLVDVEEAPQGCIAEINSSNSLDKDLADTTSSILFGQQKDIDSSEMVKRSKENFRLIEFSSYTTSNQPTLNDTKVDNILYDEIISRSESITETYSVPEEEEGEEESLISSKIQPSTKTGLTSSAGRNVRFQEIVIDDSPSIISLHMSESLDHDKSDSIQSLSPIPETYTTERRVTYPSSELQNPTRQKVFDSNNYVDYYPSFLDHKPAPSGGSTSSEKTSLHTLPQEKTNLTDDYENGAISENEMEIAVELLHEFDPNKNVTHDESTNQFDDISLSSVEENDVQSHGNEERILTHLSTKHSTEKNPILQAPVLREKLSERLTHFMKSRKAKNPMKTFNDQDEVGVDKSKLNEEKKLKHNLKFNQSLLTICPPPPLSIQEQLYLPDSIPSNELGTSEKFIAYHSIRVSENRFLKVQLERYFGLEESNEFDWKDKEKILRPDLIIKDKESQLEIGIIFIRLSNLISGSHKPEETSQIENDNEESIPLQNNRIKKLQEACFTSIYRLSKTYPRLLIILEAYPIKPITKDSSDLIAYAYTPPILKSLEVLKVEVLKLEEKMNGLGIDFNADLSVSESYERSCEIALRWVKEVLPCGCFCIRRLID